MKLDPELRRSMNLVGGGDSTFAATLGAHGLFNTFQFVLWLSPQVHRRLAETSGGILTSADIGFEGAQAFSTYLHETIHWWQHIGSTYGLMLSLSYPTQAHANYTHLRALIELTGFKKSIRQLVDNLPGPSTPDTAQGKANIVVNNHFDFSAFRNLTLSHRTAIPTIKSAMFESVGHAHELTYGHNLFVLAVTADPEFKAIPDPRHWESEFGKLRAEKEPGFYFGSQVGLWPLGAREILEGQACFCQMQYLSFASGGRLGWDDFRELGMLHGVYEEAFRIFLVRAGLEWPSQIDHPIVGLFLLICDMSINPGAGFPHPPLNFKTFIADTNPGARFTMMATLVRLKHPELADLIRTYSKAEYEQASEALAMAMLDVPPILLAQIAASWVRPGEPLAPLMEEHRTFDYQPGNLPVRVMLSHFLAFMRDKAEVPEYFCWPGAWLTGDRVSNRSQALFERHSALFVDKEDDDGIFPRIHPDKDESLVHRTFEAFYASNLLYEMTDQWILKPGPFTYDYGWLSSTGGKVEMKAFADRHFEQAYGVHPGQAELF